MRLYSIKYFSNVQHNILVVNMSTYSKTFEWLVAGPFAYYATLVAATSGGQPDLSSSTYLVM